jgi:hypothetical protein
MLDVKGKKDVNKDMMLIVHENDLLNLIQDMPGWNNLQIRFLSKYGDGRYYNVHLTKKQVAALGAAKIKATYHANEYKQEEANAGSDTS